MTSLRSSDITLHVCDYCEAEGRHFPSLASMERLIEGAQDGCPRFKVLSVCVDWVVKNTTESLAVEGVCLDKSGIVTIMWDNDTFTEAELLKLDRESGRIASIDGSECLRILPKTSSSGDTFHILKNWLKQCLQEHAVCASHQKSQSDQALRGIRSLNITKDAVFLIDDKVPQNYACLSHCWGSGQHVLKTTTENIASRKSAGIAFLDLPQTFQDAVATCLRLGIDHIWIDSLCIIQDSLSDWQSQAARMADVYENCTINIAADNAENPSAGFFVQTDALYVGELLPGYSDVYFRFSVPMPIDSRGPFMGAFCETDKAWPTLRRGWIYQELCLSPRVIHFASQETLWQCRELNARQSTSDQFREFESYKPPASIPDRGRTSLQMAWYQYVVNYSYRELTFLKDRLPAIAAIAERMLALRPNDQYLAGLWKSTLLHDLMWSRDYWNQTSEQQPSYVNSGVISNIPTWSWASIRGSVSWDIDPTKKCLDNVHLLEAVSLTEGSAMSGLITKAYIKIRAPLLELEAMSTRDDFQFQLRSHESDWELLPPGTSYEDFAGDLPDRHEWAVDSYVVDGEITAETDFFADSRLMALPLINTLSMAVDSDRLDVLMIRKADNDNVYTRVGTAKLASLVSCVAEEGYMRFERFGRKGRQHRGFTPEEIVVGQQAHHEAICERLRRKSTHVITLV